LEKAKITPEEKERLLWHGENRDEDHRLKTLSEDAHILAALKRVFNTCPSTTSLSMVPMLLVKEGVVPPSWMVHDTSIVDEDGNTLEMLCIIHGV